MATGIVVLQLCAPGLAGFISPFDAWKGPAPLVEPDEGGARQLEQAILNLSRGDLEACRRQLADARQDLPELPSVEVMLARIRLYSGELAAAQAHLTAAAIENADDPDLALASAELAMAQGRLGDARLQLLHALAASAPEAWSPDQYARHQRLCRDTLSDVLLKLGQLDAAHSLLAELASQGEPQAPVLHRLGIVLIRLGRSPEGLSQLEAARTADNSLPPPQLTLAGLKNEMGDHAAVGPLLETALSEFPDDPRSHCELGAWHLLNDRPAEALGILSAAADRFPDSFAAQLHLGQVLLAHGEFARAEDALEAAFLLNPADRTVVVQLSACLLEQDEAAEDQRALRLMQLAMQGVGSPTPLAQSVLAWAERRCGRPERAARIMAESNRHAATDPADRYVIGRLFSESNQLLQSRELLSSAADDPQWHLFRPLAQRLVREATDRRSASEQDDRVTEPISN